MEVCTTLGMLTAEQAEALKNAGLTAYNHNLDTSREYYGKVITSRTYEDRLQTISNVRDAGIHVCSGGILGLGEDEKDRVGLIWEMSRLPENPESFPVNALVPIKGTPMENNKPVEFQELLRTVATARIVLPSSIIRLAAGRHMFTESEQAMCFLAGANAVFTGERGAQRSDLAVGQAHVLGLAQQLHIQHRGIHQHLAEINQGLKLLETVFDLDGCCIFLVAAA